MFFLHIELFHRIRRDGFPQLLPILGPKRLGLARPEKFLLKLIPGCRSKELTDGVAKHEVFVGLDSRRGVLGQLNLRVQF